MKKTIRIVHDEDCSSPRENDNLAVLLLFHKRYKLGDDEDVRAKAGMTYRTEDFGGWAEMEKMIRKEHGGVILPVFMYDHSMQAFSTESFIGRAQHAEWDSGQVGFAVVSSAAVLKEYGKLSYAMARKVAIGEVEEYSRWSGGDCWGFQILEDGKEIDSCYGFIGREYCEQEAKATAGEGAVLEDER